MSEYNENAYYYKQQVVIRDTTGAGSTSGGLVVLGGISGKDTYITGHVSVNNVKITPNRNDIIFEQQATLSITENFTNITDFYFDDSVANSFKATINVTVSGGISKYALWEINGVYKPAGWVITSSFAGDQTGINFKITNVDGRGQIQYTNSNVNGTTTTIRYRANTTAPPGSTPLGSDSSIINNTSGPYIANRLLYSNSTDTIANTDLVYTSNVFTIGGTSRILAQNANSFTNFSNGGGITSMGDASVAKKMIVGEKVGIVTTAPQYHLDVTGDINFTGNFYKNGSLYSGSSIWDTNANNEIFTTQNLGIGTSDPTYKLDVSGGLRVTEAVTAGALYVTNELATNISSGTLNLSTGLTSSSAKITDISNTNASIGTLNVTALTAGNINFTGTLYENGTPYVNSQWTTGTGGNLSYTNGNVGINTTAPLSTLDVRGTINVSSGLTAANLNVSGATVIANVTTGTISASTINSSLIAASTMTGGTLSLSGDLFVAGSLTAVNITTTNLMDTNITAGVAKITDANITTATVATLLNTNTISTNVSSATLTLSTGLTSSTAQITNQSSTNISSATLNVSTGITSSSLQATNANVTTSTIATLLNTNTVSTNVSAGTINLSNGLTSASIQATNANVTNLTVATLLTTNQNSTNVSSATLNLSTGLTSASAQITNQNSTNISSATMSLSTGLTSASAQITNAAVTTATIATLLNTNAVSTNVSAATLTLSTGLTTASAQITNENVTTSTIGTARVTTSLLATGTSNTIGNIFTTGGNVGIGVVNPSLALEVSGRSVMKNAGTGTSGALYLDDSNKGIQYSGNNESVNSYFEGSFPTDGIAVFGFSDGALGTRRGGNKTALVWNSTGNVGIGTTAPGNTLDVSGTIRASTSITTGAVYSTNITSTNVVATNSSFGTINASGATMGGSLVPSTNITYDLGSSSLRWRDLYLSGNTIHLGEKQLSLSGDTFQLENISVTSTQEATSTTSAALLVSGGVGIRGKLRVAGTGYITNAEITSVTATNIAVSNVIANNVSTGTLQAPNGITVGNINFTGSLYQNGVAYLGSQWTTTSGNVSYTTGSVIATNSLTTNASVGVLIASTGLTSASAQITNAAVTTATVATLLNTNAVSTNVSSGTLTLSTGLTSASAQITNANVTTATIATLLNTNAVSTNFSAGTVSATTITGGSISLSGNLSVAGTLTVVNITATNLMDTNLTAGSARITTNLAAIGNSNTVGAIITTGGNVGIGTTAPSYTLDINGTTRINTTRGVLIGSSADIDAGRLISALDSTMPNNGFRYITFGKANGTYNQAEIIYKHVADGSTSNYIGLGVHSTPTVAVNGAGNVGIGTTAPSSILDIVSSSPILQIRDTSLGSGKIYFGNSSHGVGRNASISTLTDGNDVTVWTNGASGSVGFATSLTERMRITPAGNVGIGTAAPSANLHVIGNTRTNSIEMNAGGGAKQFASGIQGGGAATGTTSFPFTFTNIPVVVASISQNDNGSVFGVQITSISTTGFSYRKTFYRFANGYGGEAVSEHFYWIAIG